MDATAQIAAGGTPDACRVAAGRKGSFVSGKDLGYVGTDPDRLEHVRHVLEGTGIVVEIALAAAGDALAHGVTGPDVALLDATGMDVDRAIGGIALLGAAWPETPVVVSHDDTDPAVVRSVLDAGALSIVASTTSDRELRHTLEAALEGHGLIDLDIVRPVIDLYATLHAESRRRNRAVIESLAAAVEAKDTVTSRHLRAVGRLATQLARAVDPTLVDSDDFLYGCLLHDVGKIGVPEKILTKPGPLSPDEWEVMRRHPQTGARVVRPLGLSRVVGDIVLYHHERWDGGGYPEGLAGDDIPLAARVFSVCDALEAMTATRPYRRPLPASVAFQRVLLEGGVQFDPDVVAALEEGVRGGDIDLEDAGGLDVEQPPRRRISSLAG
jgi:putative nucleotidyltransferase with HDIG domain